MRLPTRLAALGLLLALSRPALAQLPPGLPIPPQNFAVPHFWGAPGALSIDHESLGGASVADRQSDWGGNPACVIDFNQPAALYQNLYTPLKNLPGIREQYLGFAAPLKTKRPSAVKVSLIDVRGSGGLAGTPLSLNTRETDPSLELAYSPIEGLSVGVAFAYLSTQSDYTLPGVGNVTRLTSKPSSLGGRLGILYAPKGQFSFGASGDYYSEAVEQSVPALSLPAQKFHFRSEDYRIGMGYYPDPQTKALLEYQEVALHGNNAAIAQHVLLMGVEHSFGPITPRIGLYNGQLTAGLSATLGKVTLTYGLTNRFSQNLPGQGAKPAQALEITAPL